MFDVSSNMSRERRISRPFLTHSPSNDGTVVSGKRGSTMKDVTADAAKKGSPKQRGTLNTSENNTIQRYYGQIGIPAVAAAARYQGDSKNPAHARPRSTYPLRPR
jgi:hypothetical protein